MGKGELCDCDGRLMRAQWVDGQKIIFTHLNSEDTGPLRKYS